MTERQDAERHWRCSEGLKRRLPREDSVKPPLNGAKEEGSVVPVEEIDLCVCFQDWLGVLVCQYNQLLRIGYGGLVGQHVLLLTSVSASALLSLRPEVT